MEPSKTVEITFPTRTRTFYQENFENAKPVLTGDSWTNEVETKGTAFNRCFTEEEVGGVVTVAADPNCEAEETDRLANGVVLQVGRQFLAELDRNAGADTHLHGLFTGLEVAVDENSVDRFLSTEADGTHTDFLHLLTERGGHLTHRRPIYALSDVAQKAALYPNFRFYLFERRS